MSQPSPVDEPGEIPPRKRRDWPNGKPGNHRRGNSRGTKSGSRRGTLKAELDPLILRRRQLATRLWNEGHGGIEIHRRINLWLESEGQKPISQETIYRDHCAIIADMRRAYESTIDEERIKQIGSLMQLKQDAWTDYNAARKKGENTSGYITAIRQIDMDIARLQGTIARTNVDLTSNGRGLMADLVDALAKPAAIPLPAEAEDTFEFEPETRPRILEAIHSGE